VCLKTAKISLIDVSFAYTIGKSYGFEGFRSAAEVFQAKIRSQHVVWMPSGEAAALFWNDPADRDLGVIKGALNMIENDPCEPLLPYLSVCITFFYRPERLPYLAEVISNYIRLANRTDIFIVTNAAEGDRLRGMSEALPHLPDQFSIEFVTPSGIGHPQLLTWGHREIFQRVCSQQGNASGLRRPKMGYRGKGRARLNVLKYSEGIHIA